MQVRRRRHREVRRDVVPGSRDPRFVEHELGLAWIGRRHGGLLVSVGTGDSPWSIMRCRANPGEDASLARLTPSAQPAASCRRRRPGQGECGPGHGKWHDQDAADNRVDVMSRLSATARAGGWLGSLVVTGRGSIRNGAWRAQVCGRDDGRRGRGRGPGRGLGRRRCDRRRGRHGQRRGGGRCDRRWCRHDRRRGGQYRRRLGLGLGSDQRRS